MSFEISERDGDENNDNPISPTSGSASGQGNFVEEFMEKVSIKRIMSGSRSIGRNEARLMLAQFRECNIEIVTYDDPGVLMLDGLPISELEEFMESGGESLEFAIRGPQDDDLILSTQQYDNNNNNNFSITRLSQLREILDSFRKTINSSEKDVYRQEFFIKYNNLDTTQKMSIQAQIRSQIENAAYLDAAHQETLLMTIVVLPPPQPDEEKEIMINRKMTGNIEGIEGTTTMTTYFGERYRTTSGQFNHDKTFQNEVRARVVSMQGKNLRQWIFSNLTSQHVWFFIAGFFLFWIFFIQTWVDYAFGEMWRALLMELLSLTSILICMMEADTEFIRMQIQERLYNYYQFLSTIEGRTWFYTFLCFLAFGKFTIYDIMAVIGGIILLLLTLTRFILYQWSETCIDDFVITLHDSQLIRKMFHKLDTDNDGYIVLKDIDNLIDVNFAKCCFCRGWLKEIIFWRIDNQTNDGKIDIHEFVQFCLKFRSNQQINKERRESRKQLLIQTINQSQKNI